LARLDPVTYIGVPVLLGSVSAIAGAVLAWRATTDEFADHVACEVAWSP